MMQIVISVEEREVYKKAFLDVHPKAFTKEGVIQTYEIDEESVKHNPMGGIMVHIIINNDVKLYISYILDNYNDKLSSDIVVLSVELYEIEKRIKKSNFIDKKRVKIAKREYDQLRLGDPFSIENEKTNEIKKIGYVSQVIDK